VTEVFNLLDGELAEDDARVREGNRFRRTMIGEAVGAKLTGLSVYELPSGQAAWAYYYELNREEWLLVVGPGFRQIVPLGEDLSYWDREP